MVHGRQGGTISSQSAISGTLTPWLAPLIAVWIILFMPGASKVSVRNMRKYFYTLAKDKCLEYIIFKITHILYNYS